MRFSNKLQLNCKHLQWGAEVVIHILVGRERLMLTAVSPVGERRRAAQSGAERRVLPLPNQGSRAGLKAKSSRLTHACHSPRRRGELSVSAEIQLTMTLKRFGKTGPNLPNQGDRGFRFCQTFHSGFERMDRHTSADENARLKYARLRAPRATISVLLPAFPLFLHGSLKHKHTTSFCWFQGWRAVATPHGGGSVGI